MRLESCFCWLKNKIQIVLISQAHVCLHNYVISNVDDTCMHVSIENIQNLSILSLSTSKRPKFFMKQNVTLKTREVHGLSHLSSIA